ncbi:MAG: hypothetical protein ACTSYC_12410, partial [Promethearchaeota archaeon]
VSRLIWLYLVANFIIVKKEKQISMFRHGDYSRFSLNQGKSPSDKTNHRKNWSKLCFCILWLT